nr:PREDICTED: signal-regulatory protein beta-1 isoform X1 [Anolis carolinensis]|eukprot:XP_008115718.1 PREDICTED: signal-regulatory protein beta-1 isoform X1 [Anolis carolinensis]
MPPEVATLLCSCLLFFPPSARADLEVTVFPAVIRAKPGSDVELPCSIVDTLRPINLKQLAVIWKIGSKVIAKYEDIFEARRPGATISVENLQKGNATLLLPGVQDSDAGLYMCEVIHEPNQGEGTVQLKIEAAPNLTHGPTIVQLGVPSSVTCVASDFYPADIFVTWLKDGKIVKHRERATAHPQSNQLFSAESTLELTPQIADVNSTISCKIEHKAIQQPLIEEFQLQVQAKPIVEVVTLPPEEKDFCAAKCLVSGFYPETIHIDWLQNGAQEETLKSQAEIMSDGTFSIKVLVLQKTGNKSIFTCLVQHESLDAPLRKEVLWLPKGEGDSVTHRTTLSSQSPGKEPTTQSSCSTAVSLCPTDPPPPETCTSSPPWLYGIIGLLVGLVVAYLATTFYYKKKATPSPGRESKHLLAKAKKNSEQDTSECKAEKTDVGLHHTKVHPEQDDKEGHQNILDVKTEEPPHDSDSAL